MADPEKFCCRGVALWLLAGPLALLASIAVLAGAPLWLPAGAAGVNNMALPLLFFPGIWAACFMYAVLDYNLTRVGLVLGGLTVFNGGAAAMAIMGMLG